MLHLKNWSYAWIKCNFFLVFFWFLISLVFYIKINIKKIQIHFSKFDTCTLIINYISESCFSLLKKDLKVAKFRLRCTPCHFFVTVERYLKTKKKSSFHLSIRKCSRRNKFNDKGFISVHRSNKGYSSTYNTPSISCRLHAIYHFDVFALS
jgi:hypothetical protein